MHICDVVTGTKRLQKATKSLKEQWYWTKEYWRDQTAEKYEEDLRLDYQDDGIDPDGTPEEREAFYAREARANCACPLCCLISRKASSSFRLVIEFGSSSVSWISCKARTSTPDS